jgi:hypothetical protein
MLFFVLSLFISFPFRHKLSAQQQTEENSEEFVSAKNKHSRVESAINALGNHGLDRCLDHGLIGFERYVTLAVLARNIQILGAMLRKEEKEEKARIQKTAVRERKVS